MKNRTKELEEEIGQLKETIKLKDREIKDIKMGCAEEFRNIKMYCTCNDYNGKLDRLSKIEEVASANFTILVKDMLIEEKEEKGKIIELPDRKIK